MIPPLFDALMAKRGDQASNEMLAATSLEFASSVVNGKTASVVLVHGSWLIEDSRS